MSYSLFPCKAYHDPQRRVRLYQRDRKRIYDEIFGRFWELAQDLPDQARPTRTATWRLVVEDWLRCQGWITVRRNQQKPVSTISNGFCSHNQVGATTLNHSTPTTTGQPERFSAISAGSFFALTKQIIRLGALAMLAGCAQIPTAHVNKTETLTTHDGADPTVAVDSKTGIIYAAWAAMEPDKSWNVVLASRSEDSGFTPPKRVNPVAGEVASSSQFPPQVRVGSDGVVYVAWLALHPLTNPPGDDKAPVIKVTHSNDGGRTFEPPVILGIGTQAPVASLYFSMATGPDGTVYVTWLDLSRYAAREADTAAGKPAKESGPVDADFRFARSSDGGKTFTTSASIDANACMCCRTGVAGAANGTAYLMWRHVFPVNERDVVVAAASPSGQVSLPVRVHEDRWKLEGCPDRGPDIGVGSDGAVHVAWYTAGPGRQGLHYARSGNGGRTFGPVVPLHIGESVPGSQAKLAVADDVPWLVWEETVSDVTRLRLAHIAGGTSLATVKEPVGTGASPAIAAGHGRIVVAWTDNGAVHARVGRLDSKSTKLASW